MKAERRILDAAMVLALPLLMAYSLIGERFHEIAGTAMLILFILHHWMNRAWFKTLFRGKYSGRRIFQTVLNLLLLVFMVLQPLCGILMSKHLYAFLPTGGLAGTARAIHLPLANWGFVLMSLHAGTHLGGMLKSPKAGKIITALGALISLYGVYAFFRRQIPAYMFLKTGFVFFDYGEPFIFFLLDYVAVMILFAMAGWRIMVLLGRRKPDRKNGGQIHG